MHQKYDHIRNDESYWTSDRSSWISYQKKSKKDENNEVNLKSYIGLSGIKNYIEFWKEMEVGRKYGSIKITKE